MPTHSNSHKSKGHTRESAAQSRKHAKAKGRKTRRATESSQAVVSEYAKKLREGKNVGAMFLAVVESAPGGGRFEVKDVKSNEVVKAHLTPALSMKAAKYANSSASFAVRKGSHVLVDGDIIRAVVPHGRLSAVKEGNESSGSKNSVFSHSSHGGSRTRKNRH
jgi:hypothetical protein